MDKSKMAKQGTVIHYNGRKSGNTQLSHELETECHEWCCCDKCNDAKGKSLDDALNPPAETNDGPCCC